MDVSRNTDVNGIPSDWSEDSPFGRLRPFSWSKGNWTGNNPGTVINSVFLELEH